MDADSDSLISSARQTERHRDSLLYNVIAGRRLFGMETGKVAMPKMRCAKSRKKRKISARNGTGTASVGGGKIH